VTIFSREEKARLKSDLRALDGLNVSEDFSIQELCLKNRLETAYRGHELFCVAGLGS
jgi:hypothetical protein